MHEKENAVAIRYNKDFTVIQANELVRSKQDELSLLEAKLIRLAITQVLKDDTDLKTYSCDVVDLAEFLGISKQNVYRDIQALSKNLMKKSIYIKDNSPTKKKGAENYRMFHWIDYVEYLDGTLTFKLSDSLKPYLVGLEQLFTTYGYDAIIDLPTNYSIRLYELLASYQNMTVRPEKDHSFTEIPIEHNEFIFTIDWLRDYFNCQDKYPNTGDFVKRVIDSAVTAVQNKTLMQISYRTVRKGRTISHVVFKLHSITEMQPGELVKKLREMMDR